MANSNNKLKAYIRYDGTGRVIAGSLILQRFKPKVGNWQEIDANECCNYTTTTTSTTTTAALGSTEYLALRLTAEPTIFPAAFPNTGQACAGWTNAAYSFFSVYAAESTIGSITYLYADSGLTTPLANTSPSVAYNSIAVPSGLSYITPYTLQISGGAGQVSNLVACP